jgi:peptidyl-prolyl cis-trans isomerase D
MFDLFRSREKSVKILLGVMLLLVAASMLIYLIPGGFGNTGITSESVIAVVGNEKVTETDVQRQIAMITRGQANLPKGVLGMYIPRIVEQLVEQKAMAYKAKEMGLRISDAELGDAIEAGFAPQMGGSFDKDQYERALAQQGLTPTEFESQQRESMLASRLDNLERQSLVVSDADARAEYQRKNLKVGLQYVAIDKNAFMSKVSSDPAAIKDFFERNRNLFQVPEKRSFDLIVGSAADYMQSAQVPETELQKDYQDEIDSFRTPERVRVRHILIKTQGKPKEEAPILRAKAEQLLKQIQAGGNFAELAKKFSDDRPGSAEKGGELGWVTRGQMVPNFEKACFSLKPGETSGIVDTEYGYHIVQVEEKQEAHTQTFEEARPQLLLEAKKQVAAEMLRKNMDAAHGEILRNPSQIAAVVAKYGLKDVKQENAVNGTPLAELPSDTGLAAAIRTATKGTVTDVYPDDKDAKSGFAVILNIAPARMADFNEVQGEVTQRYTASEADRLARNAAKDAADSARKGESLEAIAKQYGTTVKTAAPFTIDGAAEGIGSGTQLAAAFKANVGDIVGPVLTGPGQFICKVTEKIPADMNQYAAGKAAIVQGLEQNKLQVQQPLFHDSVVEDLKRRGKIQINNPAISHLIEHFEG